MAAVEVRKAEVKEDTLAEYLAKETTKDLAENLAEKEHVEGPREDASTAAVTTLPETVRRDKAKVDYGSWENKHGLKDGMAQRQVPRNTPLGGYQDFGMYQW